jgi:acetyltransferase-like isoleucine patch superfamily enzyme
VRRLTRLLVYLNNHLIARVFFSSVRLAWFRAIMGFRIGPASSVLTGFKVSQRGNLRIGAHCVINNSCRFDNRFPITIGDNVSITYGTMILTKGHDIDDPLFRTKGAPVDIGDYAWVCARVTLLPGVKLGKGCVVLSGAVVSKDVPEYHVVGGNPARFIRERPRNQAYSLHFDPWVPFFG